MVISFPFHINIKYIKAVIRGNIDKIPLYVKNIDDIYIIININKNNLLDNLGCFSLVIIKISLNIAISFVIPPLKASNKR